MTLALVTMSHSPLLEFVDPPAEVKAEVEAAFEAARAFVMDYDPDLVINIGPDHYNGFFYDIMPPFCVGYEATAIGDFGTQAGPLDVPSEIARDLTEFLMERGIDMTVSLRMEVDHGAVQPMELIYGDITAKPVLPIFVNSVAPPFTPLRRIRQLGEEIGAFVREKLADKKVLVIGSGGLSHEPPVPQIATATPEVREALLGGGRHLTPEARDARQQRVINAARDFAAGINVVKPLAPEWDQELMRILASGDLSPIDAWTPDEMSEIAGNSSHEVRTWIAAYAALGAVGEYTVDYSFYRPIPEYIAGFGVTTARLA
ncbi:3-carboxyethylcatechol 2,3-dioxygenase [Salinibacterium sp. dk2585]|uniref:3-carboxyethylcatechol 2,3-dioxygenase n=1 Tax=unclassified Salinibacterium TaxID=2632331 RepID=UPI0011C24C20|nr:MULTISPECIES: 3-carboxyethylcatechol 2,3-dioxygenase [unclassified Salinibacterium]QEE60412.1 3-carboxyethylcatechol 2,3-dioxygenase [Salinibacterium sp. dk2585]TXK55485.1 3-carboxyethylcatechol 2,3-dioxygenase [Salinibacterium sp. dk5596]